MRRWLGVVAALVALAGGAARAELGAQAVSEAQKALEARFDAGIVPAEIGQYIKTMASAPNHVGSPHDKANADYVLGLFKSWGWDARIETFKILYPTPIAESLELLGSKPRKIALTEPPVPGDPVTAQPGQLPAYLAFQGDGDVTAPLVYVNFGMPEDYRVLERLGVSVEGKIVIARYGAGWRGLKPKLAQDHGAIGCILYSDPKDDGYAVEATYPEGPARPPASLQRGSVVETTLYAGDVLTPGIGATDDAKRLTRAEAKPILKIPALPISYGEAQHLLASLDGRVVPPAWRGGLPITYRVGGGGPKVHLAVKSDWSLKTIHEVVAKIEGSTWPDQWVLRGNHHDAWVFGASDPLAGHAAMLAEAKAIGALAAMGWRPKRTLVYLSWDAEEPMTMGSTEWVETHAAELRRKAILYVNTDTTARGFLLALGNFALTRLVNQVAADVTDPETGVSLDARRRARARVAAAGPATTPDLIARAKIAADPNRDIPLEPMGVGSDYVSFVHHLGVPAVDLFFTGESDQGGVYHSAYDTYEHHARFIDPGFAYDATLARAVGRIVLRASEAEAPFQRYGDVAERVGVFLGEVKRLADLRRDLAANQAALLQAGAYRLADDPTRTAGQPSPLAPVPAFDFQPLEAAQAKLAASAKALDAAIDERASSLSEAARAALFTDLIAAEQTLTPEGGLPGRPWYRHLLYAPGRFTGYEAKTLPGVREAIEEERWADAETYIARTAEAIGAYASALDRATARIRGG